MVTAGRAGGRVAVRDHATMSQDRAAMAGIRVRRRMGDFSRTVSVAELNAINCEYWNGRLR